LQVINAVTLYNLSSGYKDAVKHGTLAGGDIADAELLIDILSKTLYDGVMHFSSYIQVGESVEKPSMYCINNVINTQALRMRWLRRSWVKARVCWA